MSSFSACPDSLCNLSRRAVVVANACRGSSHHLNILPSARMVFAPLAVVLRSAKVPKVCSGELRGNDTIPKPLSLSGNGGRAAERRQPGAGLVALPATKASFLSWHLATHAWRTFVLYTRGRKNSACSYVVTSQPSNVVAEGVGGYVVGVGEEELRPRWAATKGKTRPMYFFFNCI